MAPGPIPAQPTVASVASLASRLERVRSSLVDLEAAAELGPYGSQRDSARNLLHYLAFRRFDLRRDQARLTHWGLSSLGRSEGHVLYNLDAVLGWLHSLQGGTRPERPAPTGPDPERGRHLLARNSQALLGPTHPGRGVRIMVTMPAEAATDYELVRELVEVGMDCARINCAHEGPDEWARMVAHVRRAERSTGRRCRIEMDLTGPKILYRSDPTGTGRPQGSSDARCVRAGDRAGVGVASPGGGGRDAPPRWTIGSSPERLARPTSDPRTSRGGRPPRGPTDVAASGAGRQVRPRRAL